MKSIIILLFSIGLIYSCSGQRTLTDINGNPVADSPYLKQVTTNISLTPPLRSVPKSTDSSAYQYFFDFNPNDFTVTNGVFNAVQKPLVDVQLPQPVSAVSTLGQQKFTFPNVSSNYGDYMIYKNRIVLLEPLIDYTTSGNVITIIEPLVVGTRISYRVIKAK